jgi:hypothetical protein
MCDHQATQEMEGLNDFSGTKLYSGNEESHRDILTIGLFRNWKCIWLLSILDPPPQGYSGWGGLMRPRISIEMGTSRSVGGVYCRNVSESTIADLVQPHALSEHASRVENVGCGKR